MSNQVPAGYHPTTPALAFRDPPGAIEFYARAFGATAVMRLTMPDGTIGDADVRGRPTPRISGTGR